MNPAGILLVIGAVAKPAEVVCELTDLTEPPRIQSFQPTLIGSGLDFCQSQKAAHAELPERNFTSHASTLEFTPTISGTQTGVHTARSTVAIFTCLE